MAANYKSIERAHAGEIDYAAYPDAHGRFGPYGGIYVAETLMAPLAELTAAYLRLRDDPEFIAELDRDLKHYVGRPSPIYHARRLSEKIGNVLDPGDCLVVEDAPSVIRSVRRAGFPTLGVATTYPLEQLADANWAVESLEPDVVAGAIPKLDLT